MDWPGQVKGQEYRQADYWTTFNCNTYYALLAVNNLKPAPNCQLQPMLSANLFAFPSLYAQLSHIFSASLLINSNNNCVRHSKIGGLFMFQKVQIQILPIYVYLPFQKVKLCTHMNNQ
jgi:hypothetical protein